MSVQLLSPELSSKLALKITSCKKGVAGVLLIQFVGIEEDGYGDKTRMRSNMLTAILLTTTAVAKRAFIILRLTIRFYHLI